MINSTLNRMRKIDAIKNKRKFYWKRIGKCNPSKCGGACCRYSVLSYRDHGYHDIINRGSGIYKIIKHKKETLSIIHAQCPNMRMDGRCKLHGKKSQPSVCEKFPMSRDDGVFIAVKKYCGFKFVKEVLYDKIKNKPETERDS